MKTILCILFVISLFVSVGCVPHMYDPYGYGYYAMQDVIDYRWDAMDWSNQLPND